MGDLIVITGPPGAGKSAVADRLVELFDPSALLAGDEFFGFLRRGSIAPWLPESERQNTVVIEAAAAAAGRFSRYCQVIYDGVVGPWFAPTFARESGCERVHYVVLLPPVEVCAERVRNRTGHGFTDLAAAGNLHAQFAATELADRHLITGSERSAGELAELVASRVLAGDPCYLLG